MTQRTTDAASSAVQKSYGVVLFDFDGTIADTVPLIMESFQHVFLTLTGSQADEKFLLSTIGEPLERTFRILDEGQRAKAMQLYFDYNEKTLATGVGIFIGIKAMLEKIRSIGTYTAIVTSKRLSVANFTIDQFGLGKFFDISIAKESTARHKPFPDPIFKALDSIEQTFCLEEPINKEDVLFVGDSIHDLRCARNANVDIAIVDWTYMDKEELRSDKPDHWISNADDIARLCGSYGRQPKELA
ncbi:MAG: HAD family hydrolase [Saccharofermentanales bacterium]